MTRVAYESSWGRSPVASAVRRERFWEVCWGKGAKGAKGANFRRIPPCPRPRLKTRVRHDLRPIPRRLSRTLERRPGTPDRRRFGPSSEVSENTVGTEEI